MSKATKPRAAKPVRESRQARQPGKKPGKRPTNLTLDPEAVARGERFGQRHGASLSQLVNGFLHSLPGGESDEALADLTPPVRRLYGLAAGGTTDRAAHRAHLLEKYGGRR